MATAPVTVGVVGLGNMGLPMAGHLLAAGFAVRGYDVRPEAVAALARAGGTPAASPAGAVAGAAMAITSLPSVAALQQVVDGEHGLAGAAPDGLILIETSTLPVAAKAEAAGALGRVGVVVLDCPPAARPARCGPATSPSMPAGTRPRSSAAMTCSLPSRGSSTRSGRSATACA